MCPSKLGKATLIPYSYGSNFRTVYSEAKHNDTYYSYQAFDDPSDTAITNISYPEGVSVAISRDIFGNALSITRAGGGKSARRSYVYDANMRLCKTIEPETAATIIDYDVKNGVRSGNTTNVNLIQGMAKAPDRNASCLLQAMC